MPAVNRGRLFSWGVAMKEELLLPEDLRQRLALYMPEYRELLRKRTEDADRLVCEQILHGNCDPPEHVVVSDLYEFCAREFDDFDP